MAFSLSASYTEHPAGFQLCRVWNMLSSKLTHLARAGGEPIECPCRVSRVLIGCHYHDQSRISLDRDDVWVGRGLDATFQ